MTNNHHPHIPLVLSCAFIDAEHSNASTTWPTRRRRGDPSHPCLSLGACRLVYRFPVHANYFRQHECHLESSLRPVLGAANIFTPAFSRWLYSLITIAEDVETRHGIIWMIPPTVERRRRDWERHRIAAWCLCVRPIVARRQQEMGQ